MVKAGDHRELPCLVGKRPDALSEEDELPPGSVRIRINGQELEAYIQDIVYQVLSSILG